MFDLALVLAGFLVAATPGFAADKKKGPPAPVVPSTNYCKESAVDPLSKDVYKAVLALELRGAKNEFIALSDGRLYDKACHKKKEDYDRDPQHMPFENFVTNPPKKMTLLFKKTQNFELGSSLIETAVSLEGAPGSAGKVATLIEGPKEIDKVELVTFTEREFEDLPRYYNNAKKIFLSIKEAKAVKKIKVAVWNGERTEQVAERLLKKLSAELTFELDPKQCYVYKAYSECLSLEGTRDEPQPKGGVIEEMKQIEQSVDRAS